MARSIIAVLASLCLAGTFPRAVGQSCNPDPGCGVHPQAPAPAIHAQHAQHAIPLEKRDQSTSKGEALSDYLFGSSSGAVVNMFGGSYVAQVTVGTKIVPLLIDTGSSDTWVAASSFRCLDAEDKPVEQSSCGFLSFADDDFSGGTVPDEYLSIKYANGQYAYGPYGFESVSVGGITVPKQQIGLLSEGHIQVPSGDFAGILGLGYPGMVAARQGDKPKQYTDNTDPLVTYDTWFTSAIKQGLTEPIFSIALDMDGGGLLSIGGVLDLPIYGEWSTTPIRKVSPVCPPSQPHKYSDHA